jgi:hypothetical protein
MRGGCVSFFSHWHLQLFHLWNQYSWRHSKCVEAGKGSIRISLVDFPMWSDISASFGAWFATCIPWRAVSVFLVEIKHCNIFSARWDISCISYASVTIWASADQATFFVTKGSHFSVLSAKATISTLSRNIRWGSNRCLSGSRVKRFAMWKLEYWLFRFYGASINRHISALKNVTLQWSVRAAQCIEIGYVI